MSNKTDMPDELFVDKATATWVNYTVTFERLDNKQTKYISEAKHMEALQALMLKFDDYLMNGIGLNDEQRAQAARLIEDKDNEKQS